MVAHAARFSAAVHGQNGVAHVDTAKRNRRGEDVAKRASSSHVAVVDKPLARHAGLLTKRCEDSCRGSVAGIFLRGVKLDHGTAAKHGVVRGVIFLRIVGMPCVGVVGRDHERTLHRLIERLLAAALCHAYALEHEREEGACRALLGLRSRLLVVEDGEHLRGVAQVGREHGLQTGITHGQVVETARRYELVVHAKGAGGCGVGEVEVEVENVVALHLALLVQLLQDDVHQQVALLQLIGDLSEQGQHILLSAQFHAVVDLSVEVDGEVTDL